MVALRSELVKGNQWLIHSKLLMTFIQTTAQWLPKIKFAIDELQSIRYLRHLLSPWKRILGSMWATGLWTLPLFAWWPLRTWTENSSQTDTRPPPQVAFILRIWAEALHAMSCQIPRITDWILYALILWLALSTIMCQVVAKMHDDWLDLDTKTTLILTKAFPLA